MHKWISNYLHNRVQYTTVNNTRSDIKLIECGVPQGSVLGPLLFLIYINDIHKAIPGATPKLFADDTNVFVIGSNLSELQQKANYYLDCLYDWCCCNKLTINWEKTNFMVFSPKADACCDAIDITCKSVYKVKHVKSTKYLGISLITNLILVGILNIYTKN